MNSLRITSLYYRKGSYKLWLLTIVMGVSGAIYLLAVMCKENKVYSDSFSKQNIDVVNLSKELYIEPERIDMLSKISMIQYIEMERAINLFVTTGDTKEVLGTFEFVTTSKEVLKSGIALSEGVMKQVKENQLKSITLSYKKETLAIDISNNASDSNLISTELIEDRLHIELTSLPIRKLRIDLQPNTDMEALKQELAKCGFKIENEDKTSLDTLLDSESAFVGILHVVVRVMVLLVAISILRIQYQVRRKNVGILRIIGYEPINIYISLQLEYMILMASACVISAICFQVLKLCMEALLQMHISISGLEFLKSYQYLLFVYLFIGVIMNGVFCALLIRKNSLDILKHDRT